MPQPARDRFRSVAGARSRGPLSNQGYLGGGVSCLGSIAVSFSTARPPRSRPSRLARPLQAAPRRKLPKPRKSGIDHIVVAMAANRSFDHLLGWMPRADGQQGGLIYTDRAGAAFETYPLAPDFQGCGHPVPDDSFRGGRTEYNERLCDGWLRAGSNDIYSIGYYRQQDLPFLGQAAPDWTVCGRYFSPVMAPSQPNRIYAHAGVTDRLERPARPLHAADDLGPTRRGGAPGHLLLLGSFLPLALGRSVRGHLAPLLRVRRRLRVGKVARGRLRGPALRRTRDRNFVGLSPLWRHPRRRVLARRGLSGRHHRGGLGAHRSRHQLRRLGRVLRPRRSALRQ